MAGLLRAFFLGGTPRERSAVKWLSAALLLVVWVVAYTWASFAVRPQAGAGLGWVEWAPCHWKWATLASWTGAPVSDQAAAGAGCPHWANESIQPH